MTRGDGRTESALRPTEKELDAKRIEIECNETEGRDREDYTVRVCPKSKGKSKDGFAKYQEPIVTSFAGRGATEKLLDYIKKVL
jgi:hypothetical protein